jgi:hypothetical protein
MGSRIAQTLRRALLLLLLVVTRSAIGADPPAPTPADALLRLVPPDAAVVVTVENLRDQASAFLKSRLAVDLMRLPAVRGWFASEKYQQFERSRGQIEALLGANMTELRDELLGDAVVLALRLPADPQGDASGARGILVVKVRDIALLKRLIHVVNSTQQESGELAGVAERQRAGTTYYIREFPPAANRPPEWYVTYPDGTFAFSNSESMIQSVVDRKAQGHDSDDGGKAGGNIDSGLGGQPRFTAVQAKLPARALARVFVDPRRLERLLTAQPRTTKPDDVRVLAVLERYIAAVDFAGAALTWSHESIVIHSVETLKPSLLDPWLRHWISDSRRLDPAHFPVPPTAVAVATGHLDAVAVLDAIAQLVPDESRPKLANLETLLTGLLLGQELRTKILPRLGPGVLAYFDTPPSHGKDDQAGTPGSKPSAAAGWPFPLVVVVGLGVDSKPATAITLGGAADNALRTVLALMALDDKRDQGRGRITTHIVAGTPVTTLDPPIPFAYAIDRVSNRLVLSSSSTAVARYLEAASDPAAGERLRRLRASAQTNAENFAVIDLDAINHMAAQHRASLVRTLAARQHRSVDEVDHDLSHVLALARLFQAAFVASRFDDDATAVHRSIGLIRHAEGRP